MSEVATYQELIDKEKLQSERSFLDQQILQIFIHMREVRAERNYVSLVQIMASAQDQIDDLEWREAKEYDSQIQALKSDLTGCLREVYSDSYAMAQFAFELRVFDTKQAQISNKLDFYT